MATRSTIALEFADGSVHQIYCHWDGYLSHNGAILFEHYSDPFKLRDLIDLGSISSLGPNIGEQHSFDNPYLYGSPEYFAEQERRHNFTTFYGRDRGEEGSQSQKFVSFDVYSKTGMREEFDYILRCIDGKATWLVRAQCTNDRFFLLEDELAAEQNEEEAA